MTFDAGKFPPFIYVPAMTLRFGGGVRGVRHTPRERAILRCSIKSAAVGAYAIRPYIYAVCNNEQHTLFK